MKNRYKYLLSFIVLLASLLSVGCKTQKSSLKTFVDPTIQAANIKSVVIFQMRNTALDPGEALDINRTITQKFLEKNSNVKVIGSVEATKMLNDAGLVEDYSKFLHDFEYDGIPNTNILKKIGEALHVDAILQGRLSDVHETDGEAGKHGATTSLTVRYTLLSTHNGNTLWEGTSNGKKTGRTTFSKAPPLYEVITIALKKILSDLPTLGS